MNRSQRAWKNSDEKIAALEARIAELEEEDRQWDKHGLVQVITQNQKLREYARHKPDCQRHGFLQCTCGFAELYKSLGFPVDAAGEAK
jgi:hypothetical protein